MDAMERLTGVRPAKGGRHPDFGTHNALLSLGDRTYLEVIAPDPTLAAPRRGRLSDRWSAAGLVTWATGSSDLEGDAAACPVPLGPVGSGSRSRADGSVIRWTMTDLYADRERGVVPFLLDWGDTPHPGRSAPACGRLQSVRLSHPDPDRIRAALESIGLGDVPLANGPAGISAVLETPRGVVRL